MISLNYGTPPSPAPGALGARRARSRRCARARRGTPTRASTSRHVFHPLDEPKTRLHARREDDRGGQAPRRLSRRQGCRGVRGRPGHGQAQRHEPVARRRDRSPGDLPHRWLRVLLRPAEVRLSASTSIARRERAWKLYLRSIAMANVRVSLIIIHFGGKAIGRPTRVNAIESLERGTRTS